MNVPRHRFFSKTHLFNDACPFQDGEDPVSVITEGKFNSPFLMATGDDILHITQYRVITEKVVLCSVGSFPKAILSLFAAYYVFDMAYPIQCRNTLLYMSKFILKLSCLDKLTSSALAAISTMEKL